MKPRGWNVRPRDRTLRRNNLRIPGGGVCYGDGRLAEFKARSQYSPACAYGAVLIDEVGDFGFGRDVSFAIGVSSKPPSDFDGKAVRAYNVPWSWVAGYGTHFISCPGPDGQQDWYVSPWDPSTIKAGDEVGVMVLKEKPRDFLIFHNGEQVMRFSTEIPEGEVYMIVDVFGSVTQVTLKNALPPKQPLKARNLVTYAS
jgi:hypothetical protein